MLERFGDAMIALPQSDLEMIRLHGGQLERSMAEIISRLEVERDELHGALKAIMDARDRMECADTHECYSKARALLWRGM